MTGKKTVLIVDDIEDVREALALVLEDEGYNVVQAANGLQALQIMSSSQIDLLITDILMPEMDGTELSTEAKNKYPDLKIIAVSGGGRQSLEGKEYDQAGMSAKLAHMDHMLKKPFDPEDLINLLNQLFEH